MTVEAFEDAVAKGLGRAVLCLDQNDPTPYKDAIVFACVNNLQTERYTEASRTRYLFWLIDRAGIGERVLTEVLSALPSATEKGDQSQMLKLLAEFARRGEETAWLRLIELAQEGDEHAQDLLADVGLRGFLWLVENVMPTLSDEDGYRTKWWLESVQEAEGPDVAIAPAVLEEIKRLEDEHDARLAARPPEPADRTVREAIDGFGKPGAMLFELSGLSPKATHAELVEIAELLVVSADGKRASVLARVFRKRKYPLPAARLMERAHDPEVGDVFLKVLGALATPEVHDFAIGLIQERPVPYGAFDALRSSIRAEDIPFIDAALPSLVGLEPWQSWT